MSRVNKSVRTKMAEDGYLPAVVVAPVIGVSTNTIYRMLERASEPGGKADLSRSSEGRDHRALVGKNTVRPWKGKDVDHRVEWFVEVGQLIKTYEGKIALLRRALNTYASGAIKSDGKFDMMKLAIHDAIAERAALARSERCWTGSDEEFALAMCDSDRDFRLAAEAVLKRCGRMPWSNEWKRAGCKYPPSCYCGLGKD